MIDESILAGSFKGVQFSVDSASLDGGRKVSVKQYPSRDTQSVEDLGLKPRNYSLEIVIHEKPSEDYFQYRNRLLSALEGKETGDLIHPFYGRIQNVKAVTFSLTERITDFGSARVSVEFKVDRNTGIPVASSNAITEVVQANKTLQAAISSDVASNFKVTPSFSGNFSAAKSKIDRIIEASLNSIQYLIQGDTKNLVNAFVSEFSGDVVELIGLPDSLGSRLVGLYQLIGNAAGGTSGVFSSITGEVKNDSSRISFDQNQSVTGGIVASNSAGLSALNGLFGFGSNDSDIPQNTAGQRERAQNQSTLNASLNSSTLGHAMQLAAQQEYQSSQDISDTEDLLNEQYSQVLRSGASQEVKDATTDMRLKMLDVLNQKRQNASDIVSIETKRTTARLLSFELYGTDAEGVAISDLNDISDVSFVTGDVEVFTNEA